MNTFLFLTFWALTAAPAADFYAEAEAKGRLEMVVQAPPSASADVTFSPDGKLFATHDERIVKIWSEDGRVLHSFVGGGRLEFAADGRSLWMADGYGYPSKPDFGAARVSLDGEVLQRVPTADHAQATADGTLVIRSGGAKHNELHLFDLTGKPVEQLRPALNKWIYGIASSRDGQLFATASDEGFFLFDRHGATLARLGNGSGSGVRFSIDSKKLLTGGASAVTLWSLDDPRSPRATTTIAVPKGWKAGGVALAPDGDSMLVGFGSDYLLGTGGLLRRYGLDGKVLWEAPAEGFFALDVVAASDDGRMVATGGGDVLRLWSTDGRLLRSMSEPKNAEGWLKFCSLAFSPDNSLLLVLTTKRATLRSTVTGEVVRELGAFFNPTGATFSADGSLVAFGDDDNIFHVLEVATGKEIRKRTGYARAVDAVVRLSDGRFATAGGKEIIVVDAQSGAEETFAVGGHISESHMSGANGRLAVAFDGKIEFYDAHGKTSGASISTEREVTAIALRPDGAAIAVAGSAFGLYDITGKLIRNLVGHGQKIKELCWSRDGRLVYSVSADRTLRAWNAATGEQVVFVARGNDWVSYTPDGYFDASRDGGRLVGMTRGLTSWGIDQFALRNNRPDLLLERMGHPDLELRTHYHNQYLKRLRRAGLTEAKLSAQPAVPHATMTPGSASGASIGVQLAFDGHGRKLLRYNVFVNDVPLFGALGKPLTGERTAREEQVVLVPGRNKIEASCTDETGAESYRALLYHDAPETSAQTDLWFVGFGVSKYARQELELRYAHKDVQDLAAALKKLEGKRYAHVHVHAFVDADVTPAAIRDARKLLASAKPTDTLVLFIAGHGMHDRDKEATYYYLTQGADPTQLAKTAATFEDIEGILQGVAPLQKLFLMDTCESGEADERVESAMLAQAGARGMLSRGLKSVASKPVAAAKAPTRRDWLLDRSRFIYNDLHRRSGAVVFSSSRGGEFSYERSDLENGVFTHALVQALATDQPISVADLQQRVTETVRKATDGLQNPTVDRDNLWAKFKL